MKQYEREKIEYLLADVSKASEINDQNLKQILFDNQHTVFGKAHGFSQIGDRDAYAQAVPLSDYSDYQERLCLENEFTAYPIKYVLTTSGTTGKQKRFPLTQAALSRYSSYIYDMPFALTDAVGKSLHTSIFRSPDRITLLSNAYFSHLAQEQALDSDDFVGGKELLFSDDIQDVHYVKAWLLLSHPEIVTIQSIFLYDLLLILRYLEDHGRRLVSDMRNRCVSAPLREEIKELLYQHQVDQNRLSSLETILGNPAGFRLSDLLPQLRFISGIGGKTYALQEKALRSYVGDIPFHYFAYASSECMMGVAKELGKAEYLLLPRSAYYEFLPLDGDRPVSLSEIAVGKEYEPVITTFSGLYRYKTGDIIRILSFEKECPVFEITGRRNQRINIAGEKLEEQIVKEAVLRLSHQSRQTIFDFALGTQEQKPPFGYLLFVETEEPLEDGACQFDSILRKLSWDYDDVRSLGMLSMPRVYFLGAGEIAKICSRHSRGDAHSKPHTFLKNALVKELILSAKEGEETSCPN